MRVRLLGTGSADGWPNAFCTCAACATALARGDMRGPTSALVDGRLLLDCGPETPRAALRFGESLAGLTHVLVTHDHPDHSSPMALLTRRWARRTEPLTVVGPPAVVESWQAWVAPDDPVRFVTVHAGDELDADGYRVRVLRAAHRVWQTDDAVLYDLTARDGTRLLYATDTGPLPDTTRAAVRDAAYDLALVEATFGDRSGPGAPPHDQHRDHLDLDDLRDELIRLRSSGALTPRTAVVAVHLSHHSPHDLAARLSGMGVRLVDDGTELRGHPATRTEAGADAGAVVAPHRTLVVGGARSGKSHVAERLLARCPAVTYVATGPQPGPDDTEWAQRVQQHRERRPPHWTTVETTDLAGELRRTTTPALVDCLGTWLTAVLDESGAWGELGSDAPDPLWRKRFDAAVDDLVEAWHGVRVPLVAVTNEVGGGVVPASASGRLFRDELGRLNTRLSLASERVLLVTAGRAVDLAPATPLPHDHPLQELR
jgi:adenosylcobinamide kinase/adenosylcobinamide-phosphate guanylyltransferase